MQQPYIHNDTEFIGSVKILITDRDANILNADENVYVFFSVSKSKSSELIRALDLLKYVDEIRVISSQRESFSLIMKNSCGYFNAVFTVISGTKEGMSIDLKLFKSCETDTVLTAASLSADSVFRYEFKTKKCFCTAIAAANSPLPVVWMILKNILGITMWFTEMTQRNLSFYAVISARANAIYTANSDCRKAAAIIPFI